MKYAYWGGVRSGKMQVWQLFEINGKKTAVLPQSGKKWPAYAIIYGKEYMQIYHEVNGKIKTKYVNPLCLKMEFTQIIFKQMELKNIKIGQQTLKFFINAFVKYLNKILSYLHIYCLDIMVASMVRWGVRSITS